MKIPRTVLQALWEMMKVCQKDFENTGYLRQTFSINDEQKDILEWYNQRGGFKKTSTQSGDFGITFSEGEMQIGVKQCQKLIERIEGDLSKKGDRIELYDKSGIQSIDERIVDIKAQSDDIKAQTDETQKGVEFGAFPLWIIAAFAIVRESHNNPIVYWMAVVLVVVVVALAWSF